MMDYDFTKEPKGKDPQCMNTPCNSGRYGLLHCQKCKYYAVHYLEWHAARGAVVKELAALQKVESHFDYESAIARRLKELKMEEEMGDKNKQALEAVRERLAQALSDEADPIAIATLSDSLVRVVTLLREIG